MRRMMGTSKNFSISYTMSSNCVQKDGTPGIINDASKRCVSLTGAIGKKLLKQKKSPTPVKSKSASPVRVASVKKPAKAAKKATKKASVKKASVPKTMRVEIKIYNNGRIEDWEFMSSDEIEDIIHAIRGLVDNDEHRINTDMGPAYVELPVAEYEKHLNVKRDIKPRYFGKSHMQVELVRA
jgi:hypothetical protein